MTKPVRCFDVGVGREGYEIRWLAQEIFPGLGIRDYQIHGFEAWSVAYASATKALAGLAGVHLHRLALADHEGQCRLYMAINLDGHSIFPTKDNVPDPNKYEAVPCTRFSQWLVQSGIDLTSSVNILRCNVEGAEWPLFSDLDAAGLLPSFHLVCGSCGGDIKLVRELDGCYDRYLGILRKHGIDQFWFCWDNVNDARSKAEMTRRLGTLVQ